MKKLMLIVGLTLCLPVMPMNDEAEVERQMNEEGARMLAAAAMPSAYKDLDALPAQGLSLKKKIAIGAFLTGVAGLAAVGAYQANSRVARHIDSICRELGVTVPSFNELRQMGIRDNLAQAASSAGSYVANSSVGQTVGQYMPSVASMKEKASSAKSYLGQYMPSMPSMGSMRDRASSVGNYVASSRMGQAVGSGTTYAKENLPVVLDRLKHQFGLPSSHSAQAVVNGLQNLAVQGEQAQALEALDGLVEIARQGHIHSTKQVLDSLHLIVGRNSNPLIVHNALVKIREIIKNDASKAFTNTENAIKTLTDIAVAGREGAREALSILNALRLDKHFQSEAILAIHRVGLEGMGEIKADARYMIDNPVTRAMGYEMDWKSTAELSRGKDMVRDASKYARIDAEQQRQELGRRMATPVQPQSWWDRFTSRNRAGYLNSAAKYQ